MDYWAWRASRRLEANEAGAMEALRVLGKAFLRTNRDIQEDIQRMERNMGRRFGLTPLEVRALLAEPCGRAEYLELLEQIKTLKPGPQRTALMAQAAAPGYAYRISRLEALQQQALVRTARLSQEYEGLVSSQLADTVRQAYARAGFDAQAVIGYASPFAGIQETAVRRILQAPWSGMTFSRRIWKNQQALTELLNETITSGFMTGRSTRRIIEEVQEKMGVAYRAAERLVRTETAAMVAMADKMAYEKARIKQYRYMATLDSLTSKICMALDNEVFDVADMEIGKNCPPMHPHCRSTTTAVIDGVDLSEAQRRSKDPVTGMPVRVPRDMSYKEWEGVQRNVYGIDTLPEMEESRDHTRKDQPDTRVNWKKVNSSAYRRKFDAMTDNPAVNRAMYQATKAILEHRDGTLFEDMAFIDGETGRTLMQRDMDELAQVSPTQAMRKMVMDAPSRTVIAIHNHPRSQLPSKSDLWNAATKHYQFGVIACHNGTLIHYEIEDEAYLDVADTILDSMAAAVYNGDEQKIEAALERLRGVGIKMEVIK